MGAYLVLKPTGGKFNTNEIVSFIKESDFVIEIDDPETHSYVFVDPKKADDKVLRLSSVSPQDTENANHVVYDMPKVNIRDADNEIRVNLNWDDTSRNDMRCFAQWLLNKYECSGQDFLGYEFSNNEEIKTWIDMWLPNTTQQ